MQETDSVLTSALRRYIIMAVRRHTEGQQLDRAYMRGEMTFRVEYDGMTQIVRVCGINRAGESLLISERKLGS
jgi:hypothetical protein